MACGRHCCICHKFCRTNIEVNHILQPNDGGNNSFENAIPLCFDCHADMRSYDHRHPKGTKYSESELRKHRDNWYEKVKSNIGLANRSDIVETDKKVFGLIVKILPWDGSINFIRYNNFTGFSFKWARLDDMSDFLYQCDNPALEFVDPDLEGKRADLLVNIQEFMAEISAETFPIGVSGFSMVPQEMELLEQRERFSSVVKCLHGKAREICENYDALTRLAVRKLGVIPKKASKKKKLSSAGQ